VTTGRPPELTWFFDPELTFQSPRAALLATRWRLGSESAVTPGESEACQVRDNGRFDRDNPNG